MNLLYCPTTTAKQHFISFIVILKHKCLIRHNAINKYPPTPNSISMPPNKKQLLYSQFVLYTTLFNLLQFKLFAIRYFGLLKGVYNLFVFRFIIETPALTLALSLSAR